MQQDSENDFELSPEHDSDQVREGSDDLEVAEDGLSDKIKKLRADLKKCQDEKGEYLAGWQRAKADFVNRERLAKEDARLLSERILEKFTTDLLPVLDGFDMAMTSPSWQSADPAWKTGIEAVYRQLISALQKNSIAPFESKGMPFDPSHHEAVSTMPVANEAEDHVVQTVLQKGYTAGGRVIRPSRVVIGEYHKPPGDK